MSYRLTNDKGRDSVYDTLALAVAGAHAALRWVSPNEGSHKSVVLVAYEEDWETTWAIMRDDD